MRLEKHRHFSARDQVPREARTLKISKVDPRFASKLDSRRETILAIGPGGRGGPGLRDRTAGSRDDASRTARRLYRRINRRLERHLMTSFRYGCMPNSIRRYVTRIYRCARDRHRFIFFFLLEPTIKLHAVDDLPRIIAPASLCGRVNAAYLTDADVLATPRRRASATGVSSAARKRI